MRISTTLLIRPCLLLALACGCSGSDDGADRPTVARPDAVGGQARSTDTGADARAVRLEPQSRIELPNLQYPPQKSHTADDRRAVAAGRSFTLQGRIEWNRRADPPPNIPVIVRIVHKRPGREFVHVTSAATLAHLDDEGLLVFDSKVDVAHGEQGNYVLQVVYNNEVLHESPVTIQ